MKISSQILKIMPAVDLSIVVQVFVRFLMKMETIQSLFWNCVVFHDANNGGTDRGSRIDENGREKMNTLRLRVIEDPLSSRCRESKRTKVEVEVASFKKN